MKILPLIFITALTATLAGFANLPNTFGSQLNGLNKLKDNDSLFIYKKVDPNNAGDVNAEGDICLFNLKNRKTYTIAKHEVLDKTEAWIVPNGNIVVFGWGGISVFNRDRKKIDQFDFDADQQVLGANYNSALNSVFFLLMSGSTKQVDLCRLNLKGLEMKKLKRNLKISLDDGEAPFKLLFFDPNNNLLIENDCNSILSVNLHANYDIRTITFNKEDCNGYSVNFNKEGIIYLRYSNKNKDLYEIKQYSFNSSKVVTLFSGKNANRKSVEVDLYTNKDIAPFVIRISNKLYIYNYRSFRELKINVNSDIVYISSDSVYYLKDDGSIANVQF
ncbi:hypothetical protein [Mucilaginibacter sp. 3215]|uniref:hypothetical protein n=1 Tax=Mucilaginibacter sp. 3215 TaxID=3373912 RepID=UPI003D23011B